MDTNRMSHRDEGKGKLTDILCPKAQICARAAVSLDEVNWTCAGC
jgi:hypothetical protein